MVTQQQNQQSVGQLLVSIFLWEGMLHTHSDQRVHALVFLKQGNGEEMLAGGFARLIIHVCLPPQRDGKEIGERGHGDSSGFCSIGWINEATGGFSHIFSPRVCVA